jgi:predicted dehydrogenase
MAEPVGVGIVGAGDILGQYLDTFAKLSSVRLVAVAARDLARTRAAVAGRDVRACTLDELLADPQIGLVVNITPPAAHVGIARAAIAAGKHVYGEKPLALSLAEGREMLAAADEAGVQVGCAPDTFLGTGLQTTIHALRAGDIGTPFAAAAMWGGPGPEPWHPNPQFFYLPGGGPVLDMGPYYVTALVTHLGPVRTVTARTLTTNRERVVGSGPLAGTRLRVETPTYASAILEHASGALSTVTLSFETWASGNQLLEIYGTAGTLQLPDPNWFSGHGKVFRAGAGDEFVELPDAAGFVDAGRGIGAAELVRAVEAGRTARASGALALHVAEILFAIDGARPGDGPVALTTAPAAPDLVPFGADVATV